MDDASEFQKLITKHEKEIKQLQAKCKHRKKQWMIEWWAIAHSTGRDVLVCLNCNKKMKHRSGELERLLMKKEVSHA